MTCLLVFSVIFLKRRSFEFYEIQCINISSDICALCVIAKKSLLSQGCRDLCLELLSFYHLYVILWFISVDDIRYKPVVYEYKHVALSFQYGFLSFLILASGHWRDLQCHIEQKWWKQIFLHCSQSYGQRVWFYIIKCCVSCRLLVGAFFFFLNILRKFFSISSL